MDFVTLGKWLLHLHDPSDIIFREFHYSALIRYGRGDRKESRENASVLY